MLLWHTCINASGDFNISWIFLVRLIFFLDTLTHSFILFSIWWWSWLWLSKFIYIIISFCDLVLTMFSRISSSFFKPKTDFPEPYDPWIITCLASERCTFICCGVNNRYVCLNCSDIFFPKFGRSLFHDCNAMKHKISVARSVNNVQSSSGLSKSTNFAINLNQALKRVPDWNTLCEGLNKSQKLHLMTSSWDSSSLINSPITVTPVSWSSLL